MLPAVIDISLQLQILSEIFDESSQDLAAIEMHYHPFLQASMSAVCP